MMIWLIRIAIVLLLVGAIVWVFRNLKKIPAILLTIILSVIAFSIITSKEAMYNLTSIGYILFGIFCIFLGISIFKFIKNL